MSKTFYQNRTYFQTRPFVCVRSMQVSFFYARYTRPPCTNYTLVKIKNRATNDKRGKYALLLLLLLLLFFKHVFNKLQLCFDRIWRVQRTHICTDECCGRRYVLQYFSCTLTVLQRHLKSHHSRNNNNWNTSCLQSDCICSIDQLSSYVEKCWKT